MKSERTPASTPAERGADDASLAGHVVLLIASLASDDPGKRKGARAALEAIGKPAVPLLLQELDDMEDTVRAEAIRALGTIGEPSAIPRLMTELEDESSSCRWLAAESMAMLGEEALEALLRALASDAGTTQMRRGIHHALHQMRNDRPELLTPLLDAFNSDIPEIEIRAKALTALGALGLEP